jgi:hypothetical protein
VRNEDPGSGQAKNCAGQAGNQDVKGAGFSLGCPGRSSDLSAHANLEHGRILERPLNSRCEICHAAKIVARPATADSAPNVEGFERLDRGS